MTIEEAVAWCQANRATVSFFPGGVSVSVNKRGEMPGSYMQTGVCETHARGRTLEEVVNRLQMTRDCSGMLRYEPEWLGVNLDKEIRSRG